jgi:hypothetical protein
VLILQPRIRRAAQRRATRRDGRAGPTIVAGMFATAVYGGYFGGPATRGKRMSSRDGAALGSAARTIRSLLGMLIVGRLSVVVGGR